LRPLAVVFQADEIVASAIAAKFLDAHIPLIAIDIPHPGATYFGADNYRAGVMAGHHLAHWANRHWEGAVDEIVILEIVRAGSLPQARVRGMLDGIEEVIRYRDHRIVKLDGDGEFGRSLDVMRAYLRISSGKRILVGAATDPSALGALRAFEEAGRAASCALVGQNGDPEGRAELRVPGTRLIGSVAYFPEKYGEPIIGLARDILAGKPTRPAVFMKHLLITSENVNSVYPNDKLMGGGQGSVVF
jgi:ribose transport system substrate-binding protein